MSARPGSERYSDGTGSAVDVPDNISSGADPNNIPGPGGAVEARAGEDDGCDESVLEKEFCHADDYEGTDKNNEEDIVTSEESRDVPNSMESTAESGGGGSNKASSDAGDRDGYSSDDTSELSEGEKLAFEMRRAEIRRGKARASSPAPSVRASGETLIAAVAKQLVEQAGGALTQDDTESIRDEAPLPVAGPAAQELEGQEIEDPEVVHIPWERDPERPLQKLPIRLRDLNGRTFLLPWEKVKTWKASLIVPNREN